MELFSGKAFNPCPPGWQKQFDVFRDLYNYREGWARPDDPVRARLHTPEHADLHSARLLRWGKTSEKNDRGEAKEAIHEYLRQCIERGTVTRRADVLTALQEVGLEINRAGKDYITAIEPESGEKLRLKGGIYAEQWKLELADRENEGQSRAGESGIGSPNPTTVQRLAAEFERVIEKRAQYNRGRYPAPTRLLGTERDFTLSDTERRLWLEMPASPDFGFVHPDGRGLERLGAAETGREQGHGLAAGNNRPLGPERSIGGTERPAMGHIQGVGAVSRGGQRLSVDARGLDDHQQRNSGQAGRLDNSEEISHDRVGAHFEKHAACAGAGFDHNAGNSRRTAERPTNEAGGARPIHSGTTSENTATSDGTTGISAALATLERYTCDLGTALVALEHLIKRQIEGRRERQQEFQCSRGPGLGR